MSFSFSVPGGPAAEFADRAAQAKSALEAQSQANDYMLTQLASETADTAIKAAVELVAALGEGDAFGSISGHHATDDTSASSVSVSVTVTPAKSQGNAAPQ